MDVDGGIVLDAGGLAVSAGDTVGLAFGGLDYQEDAAVVGEGLVKLEGEGVTLADDGDGGRVLHTQEGGRYKNRLAAAGDDPVVQAGEQVGGEILAAKDIVGHFLSRKAFGVTLHGNQIFFNYRAHTPLLDNCFESVEPHLKLCEA